MPQNTEEKLPFIPGYTNYQPLFKYRIGDTYRSRTEKTILTIPIPTQEQVVLSNRGTDDFQVFRPCLRDIDIVKSRYGKDAPSLKHPTDPGYEGFLPRHHIKFGQNFRISATEGISEMEKDELYGKNVVMSLRNRMALQLTQDERKRKPRVGVAPGSDFKFPLPLVRPELVGVISTLPVPEPFIAPPPFSTRPLFLSNEERKESGRKKYTPFEFMKFSEGHAVIVPSNLARFTNDYQHRRSEQWVPQIITETPTVGGGSDGFPVYHKSIGMLPDYMGHTPGSQFRCGKTFGNDTRDAKRWIRGDFSI